MFNKPREAATIAVIRNNPENGLEALMMKRHSKDRFLPSYYVFPGGAIDSQDVSLAEEFLGLPVSSGIEFEDARGAQSLSYLFGAIRETFEESGLILAYGSEGKYVEIESDETDRYNSLRSRVYRKELEFSDFIRDEALTPAFDKIFYYTRWITPAYSPIRYDTRFFIAPAPEHQAFMHDGIELVDSLWMSPKEALARHTKGSMKMVMPTTSTLEFLAGFNSTEEVALHFSTGE